MDEFASSAMIKLMMKGLEDQGLQIPSFDRSDAEAHIALTRKTDLAATLLDLHGPLSLLAIGQSIHNVEEDPLLIALKMAKSPIDLIERWLRLERFSHSRHRTRILEAQTNSLLIEHHAPNHSRQPSQAEDLLVMGLIVALIDTTQITGLEASFTCPDGPCFTQSGWREGSRLDSYARLRLKWQPRAPQEERQHALTKTHNASERIKMHFKQDPGKSWSLAGISREIGMSSRSLQRALAREQTNYSHLLLESRLACASKALVETNRGLSEIGYSSGFSDQAHFTRNFGRIVGTTPSRYRKSFKPHQNENPT